MIRQVFGQALEVIVGDYHAGGCRLVLALCRNYFNNLGEIGQKDSYVQRGFER